MNDDEDGFSGMAERHDAVDGRMDSDLKRMHAWVLPSAIRESIGHVVAIRGRELRDTGGSKRYWQRLTRPGPLLIVAALLAATTGVAIAVTAITNLGKPTDTTSTTVAFPLSGFHKVKDTLRVGNRPELLFLAASGGSEPETIKIERWPIVKALTQFGHLSGVKAVDSTCFPQQQGFPYPFCTTPTFDFSHARYTSPYVAFSSKDLIRWVGQKDSVFQKMSPTENRIFKRYAAYRGPLGCSKLGPNGKYVLYHCHGYIHLIENSLANPTTRHLPLLMIGNYIQLDTQDLVSGDFAQEIPVATPVSGRGPDSYTRVFSFSTIHDALLQGKEPIPSSHLVVDVNAEANIMTALVCHADGMKPANVCSRDVIRVILKDVK